MRRFGGEPVGRQAAMPHVKSYARYRSTFFLALPNRHALRITLQLQCAVVESLSKLCRGDDLAWFLLASHNLSGAAWGKLEKKGSQLHIMHYEVSGCPSVMQATHVASGLQGRCAKAHDCFFDHVTIMTCCCNARSWQCFSYRL
jgi:tyrosyl-DNA phosphodiesterase-1